MREYVVECKVVRVGDGLESTVRDGVEQTARYMARCAAEAGHLVVIDRREDRSWDEKVFHRQRCSEGGGAGGRLGDVSRKNRAVGKAAACDIPLDSSKIHLRIGADGSSRAAPGQAIRPSPRELVAPRVRGYREAPPAAGRRVSGVGNAGHVAGSGRPEPRGLRPDGRAARARGPRSPASTSPPRFRTTCSPASIAPLAHHGVLVFREQRLAPGRQLAFCERFGPVEVNAFDQYALPGHPGVLVVSNIRENGRNLGYADAGSHWHTDMSYTATPPRCTALHAIEVPSDRGRNLGDTLFANARAAWEALDQADRRRIEGLRAVHRFSAKERGVKRPVELSPDQIARYPDVVHPVARTHPVSGARALYVREGECVGIEGPARRGGRGAHQAALRPHRAAGVPVPASLAGGRPRHLGQLCGAAHRAPRLRVAAAPPHAPGDRGGLRSVLNPRLGLDLG